MTSIDDLSFCTFQIVLFHRVESTPYRFRTPIVKNSETGLMDLNRVRQERVIPGFPIFLQGCKASVVSNSDKMRSCYEPTIGTS